jgi:O-antigen chain-terminating methyltransferase
MPENHKHRQPQAHPVRERPVPDASRPPEIQLSLQDDGPPREPPGEHIPERYLDRPRLDLEHWREIWARDLSFPIRSHRGLTGRLIVAVKKLLRPLARLALSDLYERERVYQIGLIDALARERAVVEELRNLYNFLRVRAVPDLVGRMDAMFGLLDRRLDAMEAAQQDAQHEAAERGRWLERRLAEGVVADPTDTPRPATVPRPAGARPQVGASTPGLSEQAYLAFEQCHRGSEQAIRERQQAYVELFRGSGEVVDLGAGRGEFLELLRAAEVAAYGVDSNSQMVDRARAKGLDMRQADAVEHLASLEDGSLGGVFCAQTAEHWDRSRLTAAVQLAHAKLRKGGVLVMETQNPTSLVVGGSEFWRDVTHVAPLHPDALRFLAEAVGFGSVEVRFLAAFEASERLGLMALDGLTGDGLRLAEAFNAAALRLNSLLFGHRDFALVARR